MSATALHSYHPSQEVLALGEPDRVFLGSRFGTAVRKFGGTAFFLVVAGGAVALMIGFRIDAPPEMQSDPLKAGAIYRGLGLLALACVGMTVWLRRTCRTSAYALFPDAFAFTHGRDWEVVRWDDAASYHGLTLRDFPHLKLLDGRKVSLEEGAFFAEAMQNAVKERVESPRRRLAAAGVAMVPTPQREPVVPAPEPSAASNQGPAWSAFICGIAMCVFAVWFFNHLDHLETTGGEFKMHWLVVLAYKVGGKWGAAGLVGVVGLGIMFGGMAKILNATEKAKDAQRQRA